jgi:hypothetical protein
MNRLMLLKGLLKRPFAVVTLSLFASAMVSDFYVSFWNNHAMLTSIVSTLLMLGLALAVLDEWQARADEQRWVRVGNICIKSLAQNVILVRDTLVFLTTGKPPFPEEHPAGTFPEAATKVVTWPKLGGDLCADVDVLMRSEEWVRSSYATIRSLSRDTRYALALWAPVMVGSARLCSAINRCGLLADAIEDLHRPLGPTHRSQEGVAEAERRAGTAHLIELTLAYTIALEEWLTQTMGRRDWKTRGRVLLSPRGDELVVALDAGSLNIDSLERLLVDSRDDLRRLYRSVYDTARELR